MESNLLEVGDNDLGERIVTLERDQETMTWHDGWQNMFLGSTEDHETIKKLAEDAVHHTSWLATAYRPGPERVTKHDQRIWT